MVGPIKRLMVIKSSTTTSERSSSDKQDNKSRQSQSSALYIGKRVWASVHLDLVQRTVTYHDWDAAALYPYRRFPRLFGERKHARADLAQRQTLSFLDLPAEIRNKIYMYSLNFGSIELATKTVFPSDDHLRRAAHYRAYGLKIRPALRLLRVNKQVNREASSSFYGQNEFRFTAICGHDILRAFCKTIGKANTLRLAKITEHAPIEGDFEEFKDHRADYSKTGKSNFDYWIMRKGLHQQGHLAGKFPVDRTITGKNGSLKEYNLVIPRTFKLSENKVTNRHLCLLKYVSKARSDVNISLVLLDTRELDPFDPQYMLREQCTYLADEKGWTIIEANSDKFGGYEYSGAQYDDTEREMSEAGGSEVRW